MVLDGGSQELDHANRCSATGRAQDSDGGRLQTPNVIRDLNPYSRMRACVVRSVRRVYCKNILCIQKQNKYLHFKKNENFISIEPLPVIFEIGCFSDSDTYKIPKIFGGENFACDLFADDPLYE